jgi:hypothetical protein
VVYDFIVGNETGCLNKHWISCGGRKPRRAIEGGKSQKIKPVDRQSSEIAL